MWIVVLALRRPYTFVVMSLVLLLAGAFVVRRTPTDVLPSVDLPVISVVWTYSGLPAQQMEAQVTQFSEFSIAGNTSDIARLQSDTYDGVSVIRVFLQPNADVSAAMAQITAASQTIVGSFPLRLDTNRKILDNVAAIGFFGMPLDYLDTYADKVRKVTAADVRAAFARHVRPEHLVTVVVAGD